MPNEYLDKVNINNTTYDIKDTVSGYVSDVQINGTSIKNSGVANIVTNTAYNATSNKIATMSDVGSMGGGTVTSVGITNDTNGGLSISGSPITSSGSITIGHSNVLTNAQTTQAVYPIKIDKNGHISAYGSAVTIPTVNNGALKLKKDSGTASSIYTANQSADTTLKYTTGTIGSASGWSAGSVTTIDTSKFSGGSFSSGAFTQGSFTQGTDSFTANVPTTIDTTKFSGGSFTRGSFSGGSFTQGTDNFTAASLTPSLGSNSATASNPTTLTISFSGGSFTQGSDSFTAATHANDSFTPASLASGFYSAGSAASFTQGTDTYVKPTHGSDSFTAASLASGFYSAGTAPSLTVADTTVVTDLTTV